MTIGLILHTYNMVKYSFSYLGYGTALDFISEKLIIIPFIILMFIHLFSERDKE